MHIPFLDLNKINLRFEEEFLQATQLIIRPNIQIGVNIVVGANSFANKYLTERRIYVNSPVRKIK